MTIAALEAWERHVEESENRGEPEELTDSEVLSVLYDLLATDWFWCCLGDEAKLKGRCRALLVKARSFGFEGRCPKCGGAGRYIDPASLDRVVCDKCDGTGRLEPFLLDVPMDKAKRILRREEEGVGALKQAIAGQAKGA